MLTTKLPSYPDTAMRRGHKSILCKSSCSPRSDSRNASLSLRLQLVPLTTEVHNAQLGWTATKRLPVTPVTVPQRELPHVTATGKAVEGGACLLCKVYLCECACVHVNMSECQVCAEACGGQRRPSDSLELEAQGVMRSLAWVLGTQLGLYRSG